MQFKIPSPKDGWLVFISPIFIPIAIWFFYAYGFKIIMGIFFTIWDFLDLPDIFGDGSDYDPYNDYK